MSEPLPAALDRIRALVLDDERLVRAVAAGRRRGESPRWRRTELRYVDLRNGRHLQVTTYDDTQAHTHNVPLGPGVLDAVDDALRAPYGNWHVDTISETVQLRVTKKGAAQVHAQAKARSEPAPARSHDRAKARVLDPAAPFLTAVGISDPDGVVKPSRRDKYHQVEEFLRLLGPALDDALTAGRLAPPTPERPLRVVDLGCGNAYLTFAAYAYLAGVRKLPTTLTGVDVKAPARERNTRVAKELGWDDAVSFVEGDIASAPVEGGADVVLALHACDTATDDALARAVRWQAALILAAPCCHHDLQRQLAGRPTPSPYGLLTRHGILRERLADMLTDALRAAVLRLVGYRVDVMEFVDSDHTPRNLLVRGVRTGAAASPEVVRDYHELTAGWGVSPALARLLEPDLAEVLRS
ncbi:class I SAM-dependent methyltransferase [Actinopolymorpha alba]|uniref:class I SAM-dependent methyltransferase n=1 Tax=Actinopolymorpha alba TaxID=533267 RepID=UPI0003715836|nr:SAM-dependent methyltransferase [Actinopolymorpha alba]